MTVIVVIAAVNSYMLYMRVIVVGQLSVVDDIAAVNGCML